jgi:hypothetical protein
MSEESKHRTDAMPLTKAFLEGRDAGLDWAARIALDMMPPPDDGSDVRAEACAETCHELAARIREKIGNVTEHTRRPRLDEVAEYVERRRAAAEADGGDPGIAGAYALVLDFVKNARFDRLEGPTPTRVGVADATPEHAWLTPDGCPTKGEIAQSGSVSLDHLRLRGERASR